MKIGKYYNVYFAFYNKKRCLKPSPLIIKTKNNDENTIFPQILNGFVAVSLSI